jgi:hypothetical protein
MILATKLLRLTALFDLLHRFGLWILDYVSAYIIYVWPHMLLEEAWHCRAYAPTMHYGERQYLVGHNSKSGGSWNFEISLSLYIFLSVRQNPSKIALPWLWQEFHFQKGYLFHKISPLPVHGGQECWDVCSHYLNLDTTSETASCSPRLGREARGRTLRLPRALGQLNTRLSSHARRILKSAFRSFVGPLRQSNMQWVRHGGYAPI